MPRIDEERIDAALNNLFAVIRQEFDEYYSGPTRDMAVAMCKADGKDPQAVCIGGRKLAVPIGGLGQVMFCKPISPAWVDYVDLAWAAQTVDDAENR